MRMTPEMRVKDEIVESLFEEGFLDPENEDLIEDLRAHAEALGFDGDEIVKNLVRAKTAGSTVVPAPQAFPVSPQRKRQVARKRLEEEIKS